jgi:hypothetical protein
VRFGKCGRYRFRAVLPDQREQFAHLPRQRAVRIGETFEIFMCGGTQQCDEALLRRRTVGGGGVFIEKVEMPFRTGYVEVSFR